MAVQAFPGPAPSIADNDGPCTLLGSWPQSCSPNLPAAITWQELLQATIQPLPVQDRHRLGLCLEQEKNLIPNILSCSF